eukprot:TRINITY_DN15696_c0_g1_i2.p1 TRINITY_DN15696_c0_g1~~TRINITY_DN15696_c0_g1_i2.p1  ORF type:complete len:219 (+),score=61.78 TRINITY_DN15696_c0_g1_i2:24-680(+)
MEEEKETDRQGQEEEDYVREILNAPGNQETVAVWSKFGFNFRTFLETVDYIMQRVSAEMLDEIEASALEELKRQGKHDRQDQQTVLQAMDTVYVALEHDIQGRMKALAEDLVTNAFAFPPSIINTEEIVHRKQHEAYALQQKALSLKKQLGMKRRQLQRLERRRTQLQEIKDELEQTNRTVKEGEAARWMELGSREFITGPSASVCFSSAPPDGAFFC